MNILKFVIWISKLLSRKVVLVYQYQVSKANLIFISFQITFSKILDAWNIISY